jgi:hypothetical protein
MHHLASTEPSSHWNLEEYQLLKRLFCLRGDMMQYL